MCDFENNFDDDFGNDDSFEDEYDEHMEMDEPFADDAECDDDPTEAESQDDDLTIDPFILGGAMGFAYEQGLRERKRRKRKKFSDDGV